MKLPIGQKWPRGAHTRSEVSGWNPWVSRHLRRQVRRRRGHRSLLGPVFGDFGFDDRRIHHLPKRALRHEEVRDDLEGA